MTNRHLYPQDWPQLSFSVKDANDWRCQLCDRPCRRPGQFFLGWEYELTTAHLFQEYDTPTAFVTCLCVRCHFAWDAPFGWWGRRRAEAWRRKLAGQLELI